MASPGRGGTQFRVSMAEAPMFKYMCGYFICQRTYIVDNLKPGFIAAYDTNSKNIPDVFTFDLQSESSLLSVSRETSCPDPVKLRSVIATQHPSRPHSRTNELEPITLKEKMSTSVLLRETNNPFSSTPVPSPIVNERFIDTPNDDRASPKFSDANLPDSSLESPSTSTYSTESSTRVTCNNKSFTSILLKPSYCTNEPESTTPNDGYSTIETSTKTVDSSGYKSEPSLLKFERTMHESYTVSNPDVSDSSAL